MKFEKWNIGTPDPQAVDRLREAGYSDLLSTVLAARGVGSAESAAEFLDRERTLTLSPMLMRDMDKAVGRIQRAVAEGETVAVFGDYDVDGITSTVLLMDYLKSCGVKCLRYIPRRIEDGYGLSKDAIRSLRDQGATLMVTVDCGITGNGEVDFANSIGLDVVVTDHHECKEALPRAAAVVDPHRPDCPYPFKGLAGVGVALMLALAVAGPESAREILEEFSDLAAVGTVADVMPMTGANRAIVSLGLARLEPPRRLGFASLIQCAGLAEKQVTSVSVGYTLAPRINAAGRMEQAMVALELLLTRDEERGEALAHTLCRLNRERQAIELSIYDECVALLEARPQLTAPAIVLAGEGWHQGVVGIVASRLAEKYSCPAFMICLEHGQGKGSCRSFGGFNLFAALERCARLLEGFGGHEMAAGFTILEENIPAFRDEVCRLVTLRTGGEPMEAAISVDAEIDHCGQLTAPQVESLSELEPFGTGNPKPVLLLRGACVVSCCDVGGGRHLKMKLRRDAVVLDAIFFSANAAACGVSAGDRLDVIFTPQINEFRGSRAVQLQLCDLRPAPARAQLEQELFQRLREGEALSRWEAGLLLPSRQDFTRLWRFLEHNAVGGFLDAGPALLRQAARLPDGRCSYGRTLVCLYVMGDRGLIRLEAERLQLCRPEYKVDLEAAALMCRLREFLEDN